MEQLDMQSLSYIVAMIGILLMIGLSCSGSAIGVVIGGSAVIGMLKKKPEAFGSGLILSGMPATQGLYGFVGFIMFSNLISTQHFCVNRDFVDGAVEISPLW